VRQSAVEAGAYGIEVARKGLTEDDQSLIEKIRGYGVEVIELSDEERQAFVDATRARSTTPGATASAPISSRWPKSRSPTADRKRRAAPSEPGRGHPIPPTGLFPR
jgi:hypothetical protein